MSIKWYTRAKSGRHFGLFILLDTEMSFAKKSAIKLHLLQLGIWKNSPVSKIKFLIELSIPYLLETLIFIKPRSLKTPSVIASDGLTFARFFLRL